MRQMVIGVKEEGGEYLLSSDTSLPIRIYSDRTIEDDFLIRFRGHNRRESLSVDAFNSIMAELAQ